ncbi:MAG: DUF4177 domain-containing protein [Candidatus Coatesbacteria bacterium]|nr:DUF4177 domain-containing protein [Candidatus Coatesbacteria bacterium]
MKWEYKTIQMGAGGLIGGRISTDKLEALMNSLGSEGWELVTSFATSFGAGMTRDAVLIFKRKIDG